MTKSRPTLPPNYGSDGENAALMDRFFVIRCRHCGRHSIRFTAFELLRFGGHELPRTMQTSKRRTCPKRNFVFFEVCTSDEAISEALLERLLSPTGVFPLLKFYPSPSDPYALTGVIPLAHSGALIDRLL
jgi:hypothetical protein